MGQTATGTPALERGPDQAELTTSPRHTDPTKANSCVVQCPGNRPGLVAHSGVETGSHSPIVDRERGSSSELPVRRLARVSRRRTICSCTHLRSASIGAGLGSQLLRKAFRASPRVSSMASNKLFRSYERLAQVGGDALAGRFTLS